MFEAVGFFLPILEAMVAGYLVTAAVYMAAMFLITRLGRATLMQGDRPSSAYTALHLLAWGIAAAAGAYVCCGLSPLAPYGTLGFPVALCIIFLLIVLRNFRQLPGQMSPLALTANLAVMIAGTIAALFAHSALPLRS